MSKDLTYRDPQTPLYFGGSLDIGQRKSLFISAGHDHKDPGASCFGVTEADIVLEFRDMLGAELYRRQLRFTMDGTKGQNLPLREAVTIARQNAVAVEFHCNAAGFKSATGTETLSAPAHFPLGKKITDCISDCLGIADRGAKPEGSGQHSRLAFISTGHGIIVELFFITNPDDLSKYQELKHDLVQRLADVLEQEVLG